MTNILVIETFLKGMKPIDGLSRLSRTPLSRHFLSWKRDPFIVCPKYPRWALRTTSVAFSQSYCLTLHNPRRTRFWRKSYRSDQQCNPPIRPKARDTQRLPQ